MSQFKRIETILSHLHKAGVSSANELARTLKVAKRTVFRDLKAMRGIGIDIRFDHGKKGYKLYSPVSGTSLESLRLTHIDECLDHLEGNRLDGLPNRKHAVDGCACEDLIQSADTQLDVLLLFRRAIRSKQRIHVRYTDAPGSDWSAPITALAMVNESSEWLLIGRDRQNGGLWECPLSRVFDVQIAEGESSD